MTGTLPLSEDQKHIMIVTYRPDDGWPVHLEHTAELEADYRAWLDTKCAHPSKELRRTLTKGGGAYFGYRCVFCDERLGDWLPKKGIGNPDELAIADPEGPAKFERTRRDAWRTVQHKYLEQRDGHISAEYDAYLSSPDWKTRRDKVLARAKWVCEGCAEKAATQVHHLTYEHIFNELLWELVAVCDGCHEIAHSKGQK